MDPFLLPQLGELRELRGNPIIVYHSAITHEAVYTLYEYLQHIGPTQRLDLVLSTSGGVVTSARRLALLLREFTQYLTILVSYQARSAGTLLCLSANELVLGPMSELGPIDAHIGSVGPLSPEAPGMISAEDILAFRQMAEDWFGVTREKDRLQVLALIAQRIFPTSLSSFYRSDRLTRQAAHELLLYQLPDAEESYRQRIVNQLIGGYGAHDHSITRAEAQALGLHVRCASQQEETLLWDLFKRSKQQFLERSEVYGEGTIGLIMSEHFCARQIQRWIDIPRGPLKGMLPGKEEEVERQKTPSVSWEIDWT